MKATLAVLAAQLERELPAAFLISGDEPLQAQEAADLIRARARGAGVVEREVIFIERADHDWERVRQSAQSLSLFASRRLIELRLRSARVGEKGARALASLIEAAGNDFLLLILCRELERESAGAAWVQALEARGAWLRVVPVRREQLPRWLQQRAGALGLALDPAAAQLLAEHSEGNLLAARQELDTLALLLPAGTSVGVAEVAAAGTDSARFDIWRLADAVREVDAARVLRILGAMQAEDQPAPLVLWVLLRTLRSQRNARAAAGAARGYGRLLARAARADRVVKGQTRGDAWDELGLLGLELCGRFPLPLLRAA